ncbi:hypothetical protein GCM10023259_096660 [Thermocatellispora tengchongensis]
MDLVEDASEAAMRPGARGGEGRWSCVGVAWACGCLPAPVPTLTLAGPVTVAAGERVRLFHRGWRKPRAAKVACRQRRPEGDSGVWRSVVSVSRVLEGVLPGSWSTPAPPYAGSAPMAPAMGGRQAGNWVIG